MYGELLGLLANPCASLCMVSLAFKLLRSSRRPAVVTRCAAVVIAAAGITWYVYSCVYTSTWTGPAPSLRWPETEKFNGSLRLSPSARDQSRPGGCSLTRLEPYDPAILPLVDVKPPVTCLSSQPSLLYTEQDKLHFNTSSGYDFSRLTCSYSYITLLDIDTYSFTPEEIITNSTVALSSQCSSVMVRCVWTRLSWWLQRSWAPRVVLHWLGVEALLYRNILLYTPRLEVKAQAVDQFSVVILLIDSMSSQSLVRWLPLTKSYLDSEGGFLFSGHSRVGTNSYPNVLSILSGGVQHSVGTKHA